MVARVTGRLVALGCVLVAGCAGGAASPTAPPGTGATTAGTPPPGSASATAAPVATATPVATPAGLTACPPPRAVAPADVIARLGVDADDIIPAVDGTHLWMSAPDSGRVLELDGSGHVVRDIADPRRPEGIVPLADGRLVLAEQTGNRLVTLDPASGTVTPLVALPGPGGKDVGVDSIAWDAALGMVLVPDSPRGTLLAVAPTGGSLRTLATGLGRPVGAAALPGGDILVAVENAPGVDRVAPDGTVTGVAHLTSVDDVLALPSGLVAVADLGGHALRALDPATGATRVLLSDLAAPQGLAVDPSGALLITGETAGILVHAPSC